MSLMDISLGARSEATGRFNFVQDPVTKDVAFDETEAHRVVTAALEDLGTWWADPTHGSELYQLENLTSATPSQAESTVLNAEQQLEQAGVITNVSCTAHRVPRTNRLKIKLAWQGVGRDNQENQEL